MQLIFNRSIIYINSANLMHNNPNNYRFCRHCNTNDSRNISNRLIHTVCERAFRECHEKNLLHAKIGECENIFK